MTALIRSRRPALVFAVLFAVLFGLGLAGLSRSASADQTAAASAAGLETGRARIALVLSGGGARGASHIGVLQVFEELRIPIDYVTGNSMGAVVGGLYAAGYSPQQLEEEITSIDWLDIFRDLPRRENLPFRRKQDTRDYRVTMRLAFDRAGFHFPKGLVQGQKLELALQRLGMPVWDVRDFDKLPLPFRSVATDIETGEAVILREGSLPVAIHASMAVPGAFAPVEVGDRLLVDGMVSNNIPIDAALAFEPDVVIAIDIGTLPLVRKQLSSAFAVSAQMLGLLMKGGTERQLALLRPQDLLLKPDLSGLSIADFRRVGEAIERGRVAARERAADLAHLSVSEEEWKRYLARQRFRARPLPRIESIHVTDDSGLSPDVIQSRLRVRPGNRLDLDELDQDIQQIYAMDIFENVRGRLEPEGDGARLEIDARKKSWGTNHVRFKLEIHENFDTLHDYNLGLQMTAMPVNAYGAEWRNEFQFGETLRIFSEFYQPLTSSSQWFLSPNITYETPEANVFDNGSIVGRYRINRAVVQLDLGRQLGNWGEVRVGIGYVDEEARATIGDPSFPSTKFSSGAYSARFSFDTVDSVAFPTRGVQGEIAFDAVEEGLGAVASFKRLAGTATGSATWRRFTTTLVGQLATTFGAAPPSLDRRLGGFLRLSGLSPDSVSGRHSLFAAAVFYRRIAAPAFFNFKLPVYLGGSLEMGGAWQDWDDLDGDSLIFAGSAFVGSETPLGPVYLGYGYAEAGNHSAYLFIGRAF